MKNYILPVASLMLQWLAIHNLEAGKSSIHTETEVKTEAFYIMNWIQLTV